MPHERETETQACVVLSVSLRRRSPGRCLLDHPHVPAVGLGAAAAAGLCPVLRLRQPVSPGHPVPGDPAGLLSPRSLPGQLGRVKHLGSAYCPKLPLQHSHLSLGQRGGMDFQWPEPGIRLPEGGCPRLLPLPAEHGAGNQHPVHGRLPVPRDAGGKPGGCDDMDGRLLPGGRLPPGQRPIRSLCPLDPARVRPGDSGGSGPPLPAAGPQPLALPLSGRSHRRTALVRLPDLRRAMAAQALLRPGRCSRWWSRICGGSG